MSETMPIIIGYEIKGADKVEESIKKLDRSFLLLNKTVGKLNTNTTKTLENYKSISNIDLRNISNNINAAGKSVANYNTKLQDTDRLLNNIKSKSISKNGSSVNFSSVQSGVTSGVDSSSALDTAIDFVGSMGPVGKVAALAAVAATGLYKLGNSLNDFQKTYAQFGINKGEASGTLAQISATSNIDSAELLKTNKRTAKVFGVDNLESLKLIKQATDAGLSTEYIDQLDEYSTQFKLSGYDLSETLALLTKASNEGFYTDKAADTVKEFGLRISEMPKATKDALTGIGLDYKKLNKDISSGSLSMKDAIVLVSKQMVSMGSTATETRTAIADIFGAAGEDVGFEFFDMLSKGNAELDKMPSKLTAIDKSTQELARSWDNVKVAIMESFGGEEVVTAVNTFLTRASDAVTGLANSRLGYEATVRTNMDYYKTTDKAFVKEQAKTKIKEAIKEAKSKGIFIADPFLTNTPEEKARLKQTYEYAQPKFGLKNPFAPNTPNVYTEQTDINAEQYKLNEEEKRKKAAADKAAADKIAADKAAAQKASDFAKLSSYDKKLFELDAEYKVQMANYKLAGLSGADYASNYRATRTGIIADEIFANDNESLKPFIESSAKVDEEIRYMLDNLAKNKAFNPYSIDYNKPENNIKSVTFQIGNALNVENLTDVKPEVLSRMLLESFNTVIANLNIKTQ